MANGSVNEKLFNSYTRHQIGLTRVATGNSEALISILNKYDPQIEKILLGINSSTSKTALNKALREIRKVNIKAYLNVEKQMKKQLQEMAFAEAKWQKEALRGATPAEAFRQMKPKVPTQKVLKDMVVNTAFAGALLEEHVNGMEIGRYNRMRDTLRRELSAGGTDAAVQDAIMKGIIGTAANNYKDGQLDYGRRSLDQKQRTLHNGVAQETRTEFAEQNDEIFDGVQWVSVLDNLTSDICMSLDGTVFPVDEGPRPPAHINCRSEVVPIVKDWEEMGLSDLGPGTRKSMSGEVPETMTYNEWLRDQPRDVQDEILGPTRADLFRDYNLPLDRFVDETGARLTLDELYQQELGQMYWRGGLWTDETIKKEWVADSPLFSLKENMDVAWLNQDLLTNALSDAVDLHGGTLKDPGVKFDLERIYEKLETRTPAGLTDMVRAGVIADDPNQIDAILDSLRKEFQVLDEGYKLTDAGYFDRTAMVRMPNGQIAEVQFWEPNLIWAKQDGGGHDLYKEWRSMEPGTEEYRELKAQMLELYGEALSKMSPEWIGVMPSRGF